MPIWFTLLVRYGIPLLVRLGVLDELEAEAVHAWVWAKQNVKTHSEPTDFPEPPPQEQTNHSNIHTKWEQPPE